MTRQDILENTCDDMLPSVAHICEELYRRIVVSAIENILTSIRLDRSGAFADKKGYRTFVNRDVTTGERSFDKIIFFGKINKVWYINNC